MAKLLVAREAERPRADVVEPSHFDDLWRRNDKGLQVGREEQGAVTCGQLDYAAIVEAAR